MIKKKADCKLIDIDELSTENNMIKLASGNINTISSDAQKIIQAEIAKHPTALFFRAKAIVADETNSNGDYFSTDELKKSYRTFIGVPFFTNHNNQNIEDARGKIVHADWNEKDKAVYVVGFVDREAYPHICRGIEEDYMSGVSMGCSVEYSVCSICENKADSLDNYCNHIKLKKGRKFSGTAKNVNTGELKTFKDAPVYEKNYGIKFIELSGVADPACKSCRIRDVFDTKNFLQKAASISNNIFMYKEASINKQSSQEEMDQLNQTLKTLEDLSVKLIQNRQQVDVEFASDLVKILSELQEFTDELLGAGYAQVQGQQIPGVEPEQAAPGTEALPGGMPSAPNQAAPQTQPVGLESEISPQITGEPGQSMATAPSMPTAPVKPIADTIVGLQKIADKILEKIKLTSNFNGENEDMRRLPKTVESQQEAIKNVLEKSLKGKDQFLKYNEQDINNDNGGKQMSQKVVSRQEGKDVITEVQLEDKKTGYHPRENSERTEITQVQLDPKRTDQEPEVLTEKQLDSKRTQEEANIITQKQLDSKRTNEEKTQITQKQLEEEGYKKGTEVEVITEKQLEDKPDFWKRASLNRKDVKTAKEHVDSVISALADSAIDSSSTPEQTVSAISTLTHSIKAKAMLLDKITAEKSDVEKEIISSSSRMKYWGKKGIKIAEMTKDDLGNILTAKLNVLVAKDEKIDPEYVIDVLDAIVDSKSDSIDKIASAIDKKLTEGESVSEVKSRKDEIKDALKTEKAKTVDSKEVRASERKNIVTSMNKTESKKATHIVQTSLSEMGLEASDIIKDKASARKVISGFVQGACTANKIKLAGITNVKIDEKGRVDIAISTEEGEQSVEVSLPPEGEGIEPTETTPEGETAGEGLDSLAGGAGETPAAPSATTPVPAPATTPAPSPMPIASSKAMKKEAQIPNQNPGMAPSGQPASGQPTVPTAGQEPAMGEPVQSLTEEPQEDKGIGEADNPGQFPAGSKCPFCGSSDVDVGGQGKEPGYCECKECGSEYMVSVNIEVLNPAEMSFEEEGKKVPEPKEPELPEMPVAASVKLDKNTITKLASLEKSKGYVCPSCGQTECKPTKKVAGHVSCVCPACESAFNHDVMVNVDKPEEAVLKVSWKLDPKKASKDCKSCKESAKKFASQVKITKMMRKASSSEFPKANCIELIARQYGSNAVSTFGPCKGKPLAECVCKELQQFGFTSKRKMKKLAEVMTQVDPMEQCLKDHMNKGYKKAQACIICNALKNKYASKIDDNIYAQAWGDEKDLNEEDLDVMREKSSDKAMTNDIPTGVQDDEGDIGDALPPLSTDETVTIELPKDIAKELGAQIEEATETPSEEPDEVEIEITDGEPEMGSGSNLEVSKEVSPNEASVTAKEKMIITKIAKKPEVVKNIEKEVKDMPRGDAKLGKEGPDNIDKKEKEPQVPKGDATMGKEGPDNINPKAELPDVARGDAYMGKEKEMQKDMPENSNKIKGTVAAQDDQMKKEAAQPKKVEHMETKVEETIPRADAKMGNESTENIDVSMSKPNIPRSDATLGNESAENINKPAKSVDVPTSDTAYIGTEKEIQKEMPSNTVETLGTVRANEKKDKQLERLSRAKYEKACLVAAKLLGEGRIKAEDMEGVVQDLSKLELERIEAFANRVYTKMTKQASAETLTQAVVMESKGIVVPQQEMSLKDKLSRMFTAPAESN